MSLEEILAAIPHRPPFLLVDEIVERDEQHIVCRKTFRGDEYFYAGHYPNYPLTPGVLLCEAAMQAGAILLAPVVASEVGKVPVVARMNDVRFKNAVKPGETVLLEVELLDKVAGVFFMRAKVSCGEKLCVRFEFACTMTDRLS